MKVTIITACYNSGATIGYTLESLSSQSYGNIEHIVVDGQSADSTLSTLERHRDRINTLICEKDKGIYDALNKGIRCATGDIVGFLHSDDVYFDRYAIQSVVRCFQSHKVDVVYGNLIIVRANNSQKLFRIYDASRFKPAFFRFGLMPPHPSLFMRREVYERFGMYKTDYRISADFEYVLRVFSDPEIRTRFLNRHLVIMRKGGASTFNFNSNITMNREMRRALRSNGVATNYLLIYSKYIIRVLELFNAFRYNRKGFSVIQKP